MPQNPVLVYSTEDGTPAYMHTVDAREAAMYGDYEMAPPKGKEVSPEERASAMSRFRTGQGATHPELQTEEERAKAREEANAKAEMMAGVPEGAQVVVMAPEKRAGVTAHSGSASSRTESASSRQAPSHPPASGGKKD